MSTEIEDHVLNRQHHAAATALNHFLMISNAARSMPFVNSWLHIFFLLLSYVNALISVVPNYDTAKAAAKGAVVPGFSDKLFGLVPLSEKAREVLYVTASLPGTNLPLNAETTNARLDEVACALTGDRRFDDAHASHHLMTHIQRSKLEYLFQFILRGLLAGGSAFLASHATVQMGLDSGMKKAYVPSTYVAVTLLILGGTKLLFGTILPKYSIKLYRNVIMQIPRMPQLAEITAQQRQLSNLKDLRTATLKTSLATINRMILKSDDHLPELYKALEMNQNIGHVKRKETLKLIYKLSRYGEKNNQQNGFDAKYTVRVARSIATYAAVHGTTSFTGLTAQWADNWLWGITSFSPYLCVIMVYANQIVEQFAKAIRHPRHSYQNRPVVLKHHPFIAYSLLFAGSLMVYLSSNSLLYARHPVNDWIKKQCENDHPMTPGQCDPSQNSFYNSYWNPAMDPFAILLTILFNYYGYSFVNHFCEIFDASRFGDQQKKQERRLLKYIKTEIETHEELSDMAFLSVLKELADMHDPNNGHNMNEFFAVWFGESNYALENGKNYVTEINQLAQFYNAELSTFKEKIEKTRLTENETASEGLLTKAWNFVANIGSHDSGGYQKLSNYDADSLGYSTF